MEKDEEERKEHLLVFDKDDKEAAMAAKTTFPIPFPLRVVTRNSEPHLV